MQKSIYKRICHDVTNIINSRNLDISKREEIIGEVLKSPSFTYFLNNPTIEKLEYHYNGQTLRQYLLKNIKYPRNFDYIYYFVTNRISSLYRANDNQNIDDITKSVVESDEVITLMHTENISKLEREIWSYKDGLLIEYLRTIDLNGKQLGNVYCQVKDYVKSRHPEGFNSLKEKECAIDEYILSDDFSNYLKYGFINKIYIYQGLGLREYIESYYVEQLKRCNKTVDNMAEKVIRMLNAYELPDDLSIKEIEQYIDDILNSDEIKIYLSKERSEKEDWSLNGVNLKDIISKKYADIIVSIDDTERIYGALVRQARKIKRDNPDLSNKEIISDFFTDEYMNSFKEDYKERRYYKAEVNKKRDLYENRDDFSYISLYALDNDLDINEIIRIASLGLSYYAAVVIMEYTRMHNENLDDVISYTLEEKDTNEYYLWKFKLGYLNYLFKYMERKRKLIYLWIYRYESFIFGDLRKDINVEDIYEELTKIAIKKHILTNHKITYLEASFASFAKSFIERILKYLSRKKVSLTTISLDTPIHEVLISSSGALDAYLESVDKNIINTAVLELTNLEQEFIDLRYGFSSRPLNKHEIKVIWEEKGIHMTVEELEELEKSILCKLRSDENIQKLAFDYPVNNPCN